MNPRRPDKTDDRTPSHPFDLKALAVIAAVGLAIRAQQLLNRRKYPWDGPVIYAAAFGLFLWGLSRWSNLDLWPPSADHDRGMRIGAVGGRPGRLARSGLGLLALGLTAAAYVGFADNRFSTVGVLSWLAAMIAFLLAAAGIPAPDELVQRLRRGLRRAFDGVRHDGLDIRVTATVLVVAAVTLVGAFFRLHRLAEVPAQMTSDHAEKLLDVYDVLQGERPIFFPRNTGREAVQFYLTAALIRFTPLTIGHLALKVGTVLVSIITVPLAFLLGRSIYGRRVGFLAAAFVALSRWHVAISRVGLRFPFTPLFSALVLTFLFRAFRHNRRRDWLACGIALGVGLHTYTAVRILPLLLVVLTLAKAAFDLIERRRTRGGSSRRDPGAYSERTALSRDFWINAVLGALASMLVFLPLLRYMRDHPDMFWYRVSTRVAETERTLPAQPWRILALNVRDAFLMFNYEGGPVWANTVPHDPVLSCVVGALFLLGLVLASWSLLRRSDRRGLYLLLSLFVLLLPSALSIAFPEENPSAVRIGGAIPVVALLAAVAVQAMIEALCGLFQGRGRWLAGVPAAAILVAAAFLTYRWYFVTYDQQYRRRAWNTRDMGRVVRGFADSVGDMDHAYHISFPHWADTRNIGINAGDITWRNAVVELEDLREHAQDPLPKLYLVYPGHRRALRLLEELFPEGRLQRFRSVEEMEDFFIYSVP